MILLDLAWRVRVFIWSFMSEGRVSIIAMMSSEDEVEGLEDEEGFEDDDGSVIGYTHKGGGIIVVWRTGGFLER